MHIGSSYPLGRTFQGTSQNFLSSVPLLNQTIWIWSMLVGSCDQQCWNIRNNWMRNHQPATHDIMDIGNRHTQTVGYYYLGTYTRICQHCQHVPSREHLLNHWILNNYDKQVLRTRMKVGTYLPIVFILQQNAKPVTRVCNPVIPWDFSDISSRALKDFHVRDWLLGRTGLKYCIFKNKHIKRIKIRTMYYSA